MLETLNAIYGLTADIKLIIIRLVILISKFMPVIRAPMKRPAIALRLNNNIAIKRNPAGMKTQLMKVDISKL